MFYGSFILFGLVNKPAFIETSVQNMAYIGKLIYKNLTYIANYMYKMMGLHTQPVAQLYYMTKCLMISAWDLDFKMRIQIQAILADQDPTRFQVISMDRDRNSDQFTFLKFENLLTGSKVISHQSWPLFVPKKFG